MGGKNVPLSLSLSHYLKVTSSICCQSPMASTWRPRQRHSSPPPPTQSPPPSTQRPQRHSSPQPSTQRAQRGYHDSHSLLPSSRSSSVQNHTPSIMLESSSPSLPSSPPCRPQDIDSLRLRRKISALEDTINRLERDRGSSKRRYEYAIDKGMRLTFDSILPAELILRVSLDVESARLRIYIMI